MSHTAFMQTSNIRATKDNFTANSKDLFCIEIKNACYQFFLGILGSVGYVHQRTAPLIMENKNKYTDAYHF